MEDTCSGDSLWGVVERQYFGEFLGTLVLREFWSGIDCSLPGLVWNGRMARQRSHTIIVWYGCLMRKTSQKTMV